MLDLGGDNFKDFLDAVRKLGPTAVGIQWTLISVLSLIITVLFSLIRPRINVVYQPKVKYHTGDNAPPPVKDSFFGWTTPLVRTTEQEIVRLAGVDAAVFLRFTFFLRWLFLLVAIVSCVVLVPVDYLYNAKNKPRDLNPLDLLSIQHVKGSTLYAHIAITYFVTAAVITFARSHWKQVMRLRTEWFRSTEYMRSFYSRTLCITQVPPGYQSDEGINDILTSGGMAHPTTAVYIGRDVGELPRLVECQNNTVRRLEQDLFKYLRKGKLGKKRPTLRMGNGWVMGKGKMDAIDFYMHELQQVEVSIKACRARINTRQPTNYGFASLSSVPFAHIVARELKGRHPRGVDIDMAPNPRDIIWSNISDTRRMRQFKKVIGFTWLTLAFIASLVPLSFQATSASLDTMAETGHFPRIVNWSRSSPGSYTIASATFPPAAAGITTFVLLWITRRVSKYMGAMTYNRLDQAVIARYFAFLIISQLLIFTLLGVGLDIANVEKAGGELQFRQLLLKISRTYVKQATFWLKWFPLRSLLTLVDILQFPSRFWIWFKIRAPGRTPRDFREWSRPPTFEFAVHYSNLLFCAAVGLLYAPLAPLVSLACALVLWATSWVFKYQILYAFVTKAETGGRLWNVVLNRLFACVLFMQLMVVYIINLKSDVSFLQRAMTVPPMFILFGSRCYFYYVYSRHFQYFKPNQEDLVSVVRYSDLQSDKLEKRFEHPAMGAELFRPMLHKRMMPLLKDAYKNRISIKKDTEASLYRQPVPHGHQPHQYFSNGGEPQVVSFPVYNHQSMSSAQGDLNPEAITEAVFHALFQSVDQVSQGVYCLCVVPCLTGYGTNLNMTYHNMREKCLNSIGKLWIGFNLLQEEQARTTPFKSVRLSIPFNHTVFWSGIQRIDNGGLRITSISRAALYTYRTSFVDETF